MNVSDIYFLLGGRKAVEFGEVLGRVTHCTFVQAIGTPRVLVRTEGDIERAWLEEFAFGVRIPGCSPRRGIVIGAAPLRDGYDVSLRLLPWTDAPDVGFVEVELNGVTRLYGPNGLVAH